jgi:tetraacyldisaccharide 4'-kinase
MDEATLHDLLSGRRPGVGASLLRGGLTVASWGYCAATLLRNLAYDRQWLSIRHADVPVISLGNITTGGTGKTPMAAWLANWLLGEGHRPGLLSRGYRSLASAEHSASLPVTGNDEKLVLDRLCPSVPHLQQRDRVESARLLVSEQNCNVLILDDGFQHRRLHRDLDLVLIDALQPWGFGHLLPRGLLREPVSGLRRADVVVLTRADQVADAERQWLKSELQRIRGTADCVEVAFRPERLLGLDGSQRSLTSLDQSRGALAFCGIGNPSGFRQTLISLGIPFELQIFRDHHHYQSSDLANLAAQAKQSFAEIALTTLKDLVKIPPANWSGPPLFAMDVGVEFLSGEELLVQRLRQLLTSARASP